MQESFRPKVAGKLRRAVGPTTQYDGACLRLSFFACQVSRLPCRSQVSYNLLHVSRWLSMEERSEQDQHATGDS